MNKKITSYKVKEIGMKAGGGRLREGDGLEEGGEEARWRRREGRGEEIKKKDGEGDELEERAKEEQKEAEGRERGRRRETEGGREWGREREELVEEERKKTVEEEDEKEEKEEARWREALLKPCLTKFYGSRDWRWTIAFYIGLLLSIDRRQWVNAQSDNQQLIVETSRPH